MRKCQTFHANTVWNTNWTNTRTAGPFLLLNSVMRAAPPARVFSLFCIQIHLSIRPTLLIMVLTRIQGQKLRGLILTWESTHSPDPHTTKIKSARSHGPTETLSSVVFFCRRKLLRK